MSAFTLAVEAFLAQERDKLSQERKALQEIFHRLEDEQQNTENVRDERRSSQNETANLQFSNQNSKLDDKTPNSKCQNTLSSVIIDKKCANSSERLPLSKCDYQIEKQRLANILANAPFVLQNSTRSYHRCRNSRSSRKARTISNKFENDKENIPPENVRLNDKPKAMVRYGEFSPLNPDFQFVDKPLVGLGEYEERRRALLEKKKREYHNYLRTARMKKESQPDQHMNQNRPVKNRNENHPVNHLPVSSINATEIFIPKRDNRRRVIQLQQELYRKELDKQVDEKRKLKEAREYEEQRECKMVEQRETSCRNNLSNCIEAEFSKRMEQYNASELHSYDEERKDNDDITISPEQVDVEVLPKKDPRVSSDPKSPILKNSTETCQVSDMEGYQKMKRELYNEELKRQIEEKRKFDEERKRQEEEIDKKIEEERLRREYEQEQAEKSYKDRQKHEHEKRILENLNQMKILNRNKKYSKPNEINLTNLRFDDSVPVKNVSFLPRAYVHNYRASDCLSKQHDKTNVCPSASIIMNAPYELAIKDVSIADTKFDKCRNERERPKSPVIPALRTRNSLKAAPIRKSFDIPPGVSMSEKAKACYIRDEKILSHMTEIRRKLRENLPKTTLD